MRSFAADVSCPDCGSTVDLVNGSHPMSMEACAVIRCRRCGHEFAVRVYLQQLSVGRGLGADRQYATNGNANR